MTSVIVPGLWSSCNLCFPGFAVRTCEDPSSSSFILVIFDFLDVVHSTSVTDRLHHIWPKRLRRIFRGILTGLKDLFSCLLTYPCLIRSLRAFESDRSAVAQCLERAIDNRVVAGSNPTEADGNFGNFQNPTLPVSFGRDTKNRWSLLSGVYVRGSKTYHTGEMSNLSWTPYYRIPANLRWPK